MITLASTWNPRGEFSRFEKLLPQLEGEYEDIVIVFPPGADPEILKIFKSRVYKVKEYIHTVLSDEWSWGRFLALKESLETPATHVHYADMDRLLRWVETNPEEWRRMVSIIPQSDCIVIGRTDYAYSTHPQAMIKTEAVSNKVVSNFLGRQMDVSAGSKSFSRQAVQFLVENTTPGHAIGTDAEWPILLTRAGYAIDYEPVDGLDWESADRYQDVAADNDSQRKRAELYDLDPDNWSYRVTIANEIIEIALNTSKKVINDE